MEYELFIVDDEPLIVDGLIQTVKECGLPVTVTGTAYSGEEALERIKALKPHIILSDIRMKRLSGLDLIKQTKSLLPMSRTILLTGYSDFDYVQTALQQKVFDYLLKPIDGKCLKESLAKAIEEIRIQQESATSMSALKNYLTQSRPYIRDLFFSCIQHEDQLPLLGIFDIPNDCDCFLPVYVTFFKEDSLFSPQSFQEASHLFHLSNCILEDELVRHLSFFDSEAMVFIFMKEHCPPPKNSVNCWDELLRRLKDMLDFNSSQPFAVCVGKPVAELHDIPSSYHLAKSAAKYRFFYEGNPIISCEDLDELKNSTLVHEISGYQENLITYVMVGQTDLAERELQHYFTALRSTAFTPTDMKQKSVELYFAVISAVNASGLCDPVPEDAVIRQISGIWSCESADAIKIILLHLITAMILSLKDKRSDKNHRLVARIKQIVDETFRTVTLESICEEIQLSPSYTSNLFSSIEKSTIKDYIINKKISEAKLLLKDLNYRIYEVSDLVGYADPKYFSQLFRKQTGLSPEQYRNFK